MTKKSDNQTNEWHQAIYNLYPAACSVNKTGNAFDKNHNPVVIDEAVVNAETERLDAIREANKYRIARNKAYPLITDQLDMIWHDKKDGTTTWEDAIQAVKDKHPK